MAFRVTAMVAVFAGVMHAAEVPLNPKTTVAFADVEEARRLITARDAFIARMGPFDRKARMHSAEEIPEKTFVAFLSKHVRTWEAGEIATVTAAVNRLKPKLARLKVDFPERIALVKTTGQEEGGAGYTRGSAVFMPASGITTTAAVERTLTHELFHVFSRHHPERRDAFYRIVGFEPTDEIDLPDALKPRKITNPDAPFNDHVITLEHRGRPVTVIPVLLADVARYEPRRRRPFFTYMGLHFLAVEKTPKTERPSGLPPKGTVPRHKAPGKGTVPSGDSPSRSTWRPRMQDGEPVLIDGNELRGFIDKVGRNTTYIIHPEEILADNFVLVVNRRTDVPTPRIVREMTKLFAQ